MTADVPTSSAVTATAAGPALAGVGVTVLGGTRSELLTARLLADQGAQVTVLPASHATGWRTGADPGIVIDSERAGHGAAGTGAGSLAAGEAARLVAAGGLYCLFRGLPPGAPAAIAPPGETLIAAELGLNRVADPAGKPEPEPLGIASGYAAIWAAIYLTAALRVQLATGQGARIEVPLLSAGVSVIGRNLVSPGLPELIDPLSLPRLPISDIYECRDGRYVQSHGTFGHFARILCRVIGLPSGRTLRPPASLASRRQRRPRCGATGSPPPSGSGTRWSGSACSTRPAGPARCAAPMTNGGAKARWPGPAS